MKYFIKGNHDLYQESTGPGAMTILIKEKIDSHIFLILVNTGNVEKIARKMIIFEKK